MNRELGASTWTARGHRSNRTIWTNRTDRAYRGKRSNWGAHGPSGPSGPSGPTGATGPQGDNANITLLENNHWVENSNFEITCHGNNIYRSRVIIGQNDLNRTFCSLGMTPTVGQAKCGVWRDLFSWYVDCYTYGSESYASCYANCFQF